MESAEKEKEKKECGWWLAMCQEYYSKQAPLIQTQYLPGIVASVIHDYLDRITNIFDFNLDVLAVDLKAKLL